MRDDDQRSTKVLIRPDDEANCQRPEGAEPAIVHGNHDAQVSGASGVPELLHLDLVARAALAGDFGNGRLIEKFLDQAVVRPRPIARGHWLGDGSGLCGVLSTHGSACRPPL